MEKYRSWIEISKENLKNNIEVARRFIKNDAGFIAVVKANAYGHGVVLVSKLLEKYGIDVLAVVSLEEALELVRGGIKAPILVLGPVFDFETHYIGELNNKGVMFTVYDFESLNFFEKAAKKFNKIIRVHLKVDSGMGRLGFNPKEAVDAYEKISRSKFLKIDGVFSHLYAAGSSNLMHNSKQIKVFSGVLGQIKKIDPDIYKKKIHLEKSAGLQMRQELKEAGCNFIRVGIVMYGMDPFFGPEKNNKKIFKGLKPILSLKTRVGQVKELPKGHCVSYDSTFITKKKTKTAVLPIGYYEGLDRRFSNNGFVKINGKYAPIIGKVCMDLVVVDVSNIKDVKVGDEAIVIDNDSKSLNSADNMARRVGTVNYEITAKLDTKIPRIVV